MASGPQQQPLVPAVRLWRRWSWTLHSGAWWEDERKQAQVETRGFNWINKLNRQLDKRNAISIGYNNSDWFSSFLIKFGQAF